MTRFVPPVLYKYMPTKRISFFENPQLRFTPPIEFNDLFDGGLRIKNCASPEFLAEQLSPIANFFDNVPDEVITQLENLKMSFGVEKSSEPIKIQVKQLAAKIQKDVYDGLKRERKAHFINEFNKIIKESFGVLCLTSDISNSVMWGNYTKNSHGDDHKGFAIAFDTSNIFFTIQSGMDDSLNGLIKVRYLKKRNLRHLTDYMTEDGFSPELLHDAIYIKDHGWSYEKEWRMLIPVGINNKEKIPGLMDIPISAISGVFLAVYAEKEVFEAALLFCKVHSIPLFQMSPTVDGDFEQITIFNP